MVQKINDSLCSYPWRSAAIRPNGTTIPCCRYPNLDNKDCNIHNNEPRLSQEWTKLRERMLNGELNDGCKSCYQDEKNNIFSMRQESLTKFMPIDPMPIKIEQLELAFSNLCNLACVHCSNYFSTKWYSEDVKFNRLEKSSIKLNHFNFDSIDLTNLSELKIIGGEPFMEQNRFIELLRKLQLENISLQICTNGTVLPNKIMKELIEKCKTVYLCVSLDGLEDINNWYRWPSKFNEVIENIRIFESWWKDNPKIKFIIHHVINALNVVQLPKFVDFLNTELFGWRAEWDWIRWPHWQELSVIPHDIKNNLIKQFHLLNNSYNKNKNIQNPYMVTIERLLENPVSSWQECEDNVIRISKERNLDSEMVLNNFR